MIKASRFQLNDMGMRTPSTVLNEFKDNALRSIRSAIEQETFSAAAKKALVASLRIRISGNSLTVTSDHPGWKPFIEGQKRGPMSWLPSDPVPIVTNSGEIVFRTPTAKSLAGGGWVHPGRPPAKFVKEAIRQVEAEIQKTLIDSLGEQIRRSWGR
jgi:hypothetical protein